MKSLYVLLLILAAFTVPVYGQGAGGAQTVPLTEGFESSFITGHNVEFIDGWQASISNEDTLWQETVNVHSGAGALAAIPFGEEESAVDILVETTLNLNGKSNASCTFWAASEETGGDKSVLLFLTTSIDGGTTWSPLVQIGDGETFPNANTP